MEKLKIEYLKKEDLKPYANNAKLHPAEQIEQIKESIKDVGFLDPIGIWKDNVIIEGHGRWLAVMEMDDIEDVPVIRIDHLTDEQRREYALVHNKLTMNTEFDKDLLAIELENILNIDMTQFGFDFELTYNDSKQIEAKYEDSISVVIECKNEIEAEQIFNRLTKEGYECRISTL